MIPEQKIAEIRERASIAEVVGEYLTLKKSGRNHLGLCPFHAEKTPSFTVNEEKGIFHCFGCGAGGDVFHFLMRLEQLTFPEAVERLGRRFGIEIEREERGRTEKDESREACFRVNQRAAAYFHQSLFSEAEGRRALEYLRHRGVDEKTARAFYLGYAPESGQGLARFLQREGIALSDAVKAGVLWEKRAGFYVGRFSGRLIFPILDASGRVVAFGGRVLGEGLPKYLNSPETPVFHKSASLYGLFQAREAMRAADRVVVVEGYLDVLALAQFGLRSVVATLGTALTPQHVRILGRSTRNIVALFDGDEAGRQAAARSFEVFAEGGVWGRAAFLPRGTDPDSFVRAHGREAVESTVERAVPLADYFLGHLLERYGKSLEGKSQVAREVGRVLGKVRNAFDRDLLIARAADQLGVREELLRAVAERRAGAAGRPPDRAAESAPRRPASDLAEKQLLQAAIAAPALLDRIEQGEAEELLAAPWREVFAEALRQWRAEARVDSARLAGSLPAGLAAEVAALALAAEELEAEAARTIFDDCLSHLRRRRLRELARELRQAIRAAEESRDERTKKERMLAWQDLARRKSQIERRQA
jgi:DNA primase